MINRLLAVCLVPLCFGLASCEDDQVDDASNYVTGGDINNTRKNNKNIRDWYANPDKTCAPGYTKFKNKLGGYGCR